MLLLWNDDGNDNSGDGDVGHLAQCWLNGLLVRNVIIHPCLHSNTEWQQKSKLSAILQTMKLFDASSVSRTHDFC